MASDNSDQQWNDRVMSIVSRLRPLSREDDFAGTMRLIESFPQLPRHELTEFERDIRDWGFVYGAAFGLAAAQWPDEDRDEVACMAFDAARMVFVQWSGDIQDPDLRREAALRDVVDQFAAWESRRYAQGRLGADTPMGRDLGCALSELRAAAA